MGLPYKVEAIDIGTNKQKGACFMLWVCSALLHVSASVDDSQQSALSCPCRAMVLEDLPKWQDSGAD